MDTPTTTDSPAAAAVAEPIAAKTSLSMVDALDKPHAAQDIIVSKQDHRLAIATFTLIGITQLLIWNMVINYSVSMSDTIWPGNVSLDVLGGTEHACALFVAIIMIKFDGMQVLHCHIWGIINVLAFLIFPLIPQFFSGNENYSTAKGLLAGICGLLGLCSGFLHVFGYSFASILPRNYTGYISFGNGAGGVISFVLFTIFSEAAFDKESVDDQVVLGWIFFALGSLVALVQCVLFWKLSSKSWFTDCIVIAKAQQIEDRERTLKEWGERRPFLAIFKDVWLQAFCASFTLFCTLFMFPVLGPFGWDQSYTVTSCLNGTFQIMDMVTRFIPVLGDWTRIPKKYLWICVLLRPVIFLPLFMIPNRFPDVTFLANTVWLFIVMIFFTGTSGWLITLGTVYCPECVEHPAEKSVAAEIFVISILTFITAGIYASKIPLL